MSILGVSEMAGASEKFMLNSRAGSADFDQNELAPYLIPSDRRSIGSDGLQLDSKGSDMVETEYRHMETGAGATSPDDSVDCENDIPNEEVVAQLEEGAGQVWVPPPEDTEDYVEEDDDDDDDMLDGEGGMGPRSVENGLKTIAECRLREKVGLLLRERGIQTDVQEENNWQDVVTRVAMAAAKYIQPLATPAAPAPPPASTTTPAGAGAVAATSSDPGLSMDPREYVKVNCLATGKRQDSWVVKGIACHKNVAHRRMQSKDGIAAPRILLLSGALEFSACSKSLSSIDVVLDQEEQHLTKMLEHIDKDKPDIMLVEKTVSRTAQDRLLEKNITLVQNVKYQLLESIARCTAGQIIPGTEDLANVSLAQHGVLGLCKTFKVQRFHEDFQPEKKPKTLMYFQGCPRHLGCTVVLCGAPLETLKQVKEVIKAAVFAAYHLNVECHFLMDEGATCIDIPPVSRPLSPGASRAISPGATPDLSERSTPVGSPPNGGCSPSSPRSPRSMITRSPRSVSSPQSPSSRISNRSPPPLNHSANLQQWQTRRSQSFSQRSWGSADLRGQLLHATESSSILVSYSKRNKTTLHVCDKLQLRRIDYYGSNDRTLGSFLLDDLLNPNKTCKSCDGASEAHVQSFSHQLGSITVFASRVQEKKKPEETAGQSLQGSRASSSRDIGRSRDKDSLSRGHSRSSSYSKDKDVLSNGTSLGSSQREVGTPILRDGGSTSEREGGSFTQQEEGSTEEGEPLDGQDLGWIWMWNVCLKCTKNDGNLVTSNRVLMSEAAKRLSFGRFLELSFSKAGADGYVMSCGHYVHRDCIRLFGSGVMRGGFCYSPLVLHDVKVPPIRLELSNPIEQDWLLAEARDIEDRKRRSYDQVCKFLKELKYHLAVTPPPHVGKEAGSYVEELEHLLETNWLALESEWRTLFLPMNGELVLRPILDIASLNHIRRVLHVVCACWEQRLHCFATLVGLSGFKGAIARQETRHQQLAEPYLSWWNSAPGHWEPMKAGGLGEVLGEGSICLSPAWTEPSVSGQAASLNKETTLSSIPASGESVLADSSSSVLRDDAAKFSGVDGEVACTDALTESIAAETTKVSAIMVEMPDGSEEVAVTASPLAMASVSPAYEDGEVSLTPETKTAPADSEGCRLSSRSSLEEEVFMMVETMASPRNRTPRKAHEFSLSMRGLEEVNGAVATSPRNRRFQSAQFVDIARMDEVWSGEKDKERAALLTKGEASNASRSPHDMGTRSELHAAVIAESAPMVSPGIPKPSPPRKDREAASSFVINAGFNATISTMVSPIASPTKLVVELVEPISIQEPVQRNGEAGSDLAIKGPKAAREVLSAFAVQSVEPALAEVNVGVVTATLPPSGSSEGTAAREEEAEGTSPKMASPTQSLPISPSPGLVGTMSTGSTGVGAMIKNTLFPSPVQLQAGKRFSSAPNVLSGSSSRSLSGGTIPSLAGIQDARGCARMLLPLRSEAPVVGIYDDEPTTVVAYFLSSELYAHNLETRITEKLAKQQAKAGTGRDRDRDRSTSRSREDFSLASLREELGLGSTRDRGREEEIAKEKQEAKDVAGKSSSGVSEDVQGKGGDTTPVSSKTSDSRVEVQETKASNLDAGGAKGRELRDSYGGIPQAPVEGGRTTKGLEGIELTNLSLSGVGRRLSQSGDMLSASDLGFAGESSQRWPEGMSFSPDLTEQGLKEGTPGSKSSSPKGKGLAVEECRKEPVSPPDSGRGGKAGTSHAGSSGSMSGRLELDMMNWPEPIHVSASFFDNAPQGKTEFYVQAYYAPQFQALRSGCLGEDAYISSLSRCKKWQNIGGKSAVYFAKTQDERLIVKQLTRVELDSFVACAPKYFKYLHDCLVSGNPTCLAKILGVYQVIVKSGQGKQLMKMDILIMENLLYGRQTKVIYDLKGSIRSRYNPETDKNKVRVLLDENLLEDMTTSPIFVGGRAKRVLERAVWNDTSFLADLNVMDYSLLVGIDDDTKELVVGIIDYIRQYTWDKHLETWVKASGILGGSANLPTVISPGQYKQRFRKAMGTYFIAVPEDWTPNPPAATSLSFEEDKPILSAENREEADKPSPSTESADKASPSTEIADKASPSTENAEEADKVSQPAESKI